MHNNPVLNSKIFKNYGWLIKAAKVVGNNPDTIKTAYNWGAILGGAGLAAGIGSAAYSAIDRAKIRKMERKRELAGAIGDAMERKRLTNLYNAAGMESTGSPMLLSKNVAPQYQEALKSMNNQ